MGLSPQCYIPSHKVIGPLVLEKKIFLRVFTIYGCGGHLGHVTQTPQTNVHSPIPLRLHMKFGFDRPSGSEQGQSLKMVDDGLMDDGPRLYYKLTNEPKGSGELKMTTHLWLSMIEIWQFLQGRFWPFPNLALWFVLWNSKNLYLNFTPTEK